MNHRTAIAVLLGFVGSCAPDERPPLSECRHGLYWADCGGNGEPILACDRGSGDCRWFSGGLAAYEHAESDCPLTDVCCHEGWPFRDFSPGGRLLEHVADQMGVIEFPLPPLGPNVVPVGFDLAGETTPGLISPCTGVGVPGCGSGWVTSVRRVGSSIVITFGGEFRAGSSDRNTRWELEILTGSDWTARLFYIAAPSPRDFEPRPACNYWSHGFEYAITGSVELNTDDTSDLEALHGRLEGRYEGSTFTMEF